jgi:hypothetical protein
MGERYSLTTRDKALLASAADLLKKVAADDATKPAQLVTVAKLLHVLSVLPRVTPGVTASVSVSCPRHQFDEIETFHWYDVAVEEDQLRISSAGHFYRPSTGGDTFTTMMWDAVPEEPAELNDYRESLQIVPDVRSFPEGVQSIDLAVGGYTIQVLDDDNPLLEEDGDDDDDVEDDDDDVGDDEVSEDDQDREPVGEEASQNWLIKPVDAAEERLAALVEPAPSEPTLPESTSEPTKPSERIYPKLSPESLTRVLKDFKKEQEEGLLGPNSKTQAGTSQNEKPAESGHVGTFEELLKLDPARLKGKITVQLPSQQDPAESGHVVTFEELLNLDPEKVKFLRVVPREKSPEK